MIDGGQFREKDKSLSSLGIFKPEFDSLIRIVPERGGLITEWLSEGKELLYFDLERFLDKDKSVRGGIPILFPICGDLSEGYLIGGKKYFLKQHGFARDLPWSIVY